MGGRWWSDSHRKIHILCVSPPWARERGEHFAAVDWARQMRAAEVASVELYCKDHHGVCYYSCSLGLDHPRDAVGELYDAAKAEGLRFVAYFSVGYDAYALGVHPDSMQLDAEGLPFQYRPFFHAGMNTPYRDFALRQLEELCAVQAHRDPTLFSHIVTAADGRGGCRRPCATVSTPFRGGRHPRDTMWVNRVGSRCA